MSPQKEGSAPKPTPPWWEPYAAEFPNWTAWRAVNGLVYARRADTSPALVVRGEDAVDLRDQIIRAESKLEETQSKLEELAASPLPGGR